MLRSAAHLHERGAHTQGARHHLQQIHDVQSIARVSSILVRAPVLRCLLNALASLSRCHIDCSSQIVMLLRVCRVPFVFVIAVIAWGQFLLIRFYKVSQPSDKIFECRPIFPCHSVEWSHSCLAMS